MLPLLAWMVTDEQSLSPVNLLIVTADEAKETFNVR